ncbi:MAG: TIGR04076 family protein [archaeon]|nr:TIGR04076 family protein [archaeon]
MLEIEVYEIRGRCPVYKVDDKMLIDGPQIVLDKTDSLCIHALSTLLHYVVALDEGADPVKLGLTKPEDKEYAYMQCVDPGKPYTDGGTVIFRCRVIKKQ